jgi:hypothetical protein
MEKSIFLTLRRKAQRRRQPAKLLLRSLSSRSWHFSFDCCASVLLLGVLFATAVAAYQGN